MAEENLVEVKNAAVTNDTKPEDVKPEAEANASENGNQSGPLKEPPRVPRPNRNEVLAAEALLKDDIQAMDSKIQAVNKKTKDATDARNGQNDGAGAAKAEMKRLKAARETLIRERQEIFSCRDAAKANLDAKMNERRDLRAQTKYKSVDEIDKKISELNHLQHTTSMPLAQEKALLKEIDELKKSKKLVAAHASVGASIDDQRKTAEDFGSQIADKNMQLEVIKKQMDEHFAILNKIFDKKKDSIIPSLLKERDDLRAQKKIKQDEIQVLWDEFKQKNVAWKENQNEWKVYKISRDKAFEEERREQREKLRLEREEEYAKKIPYEEEMQLCDYLLGYLTTNFLNSSATDSSSETQSNESNNTASSKVFEGMQVVGKSDKSENYLALGGKKKKGGKKGPKRIKNDKIVLSIDTIETFSLLKLEPPATLTSVPSTVEALKAKKQYFSTLPRGEIESIAEINQKYENQNFERADRRDREKENKPKSEKKRQQTRKNAPEFSLADEFPSLPGVPKPLPPKPVEDPSPGIDAVDTTASTEVEG